MQYILGKKANSARGVPMRDMMNAIRNTRSPTVGTPESSRCSFVGGTLLTGITTGTGADV